jgi:hypothetical protein
MLRQLGPACLVDPARRHLHLTPEAAAPVTGVDGVVHLAAFFRRVTDALNSDEERYGLERVIENVSGAPSSNSELQLAHISNGLAQFTSGMPHLMILLSSSYSNSKNGMQLIQCLEYLSDPASVR